MHRITRLVGPVVLLVVAVACQPATLPPIDQPPIDQPPAPEPSTTTTLATDPTDGDPSASPGDETDPTSPTSSPESSLPSSTTTSGRSYRPVGPHSTVTDRSSASTTPPVPPVPGSPPATPPTTNPAPTSTPPTFPDPPSPPSAPDQERPAPDVHWGFEDSSYRPLDGYDRSPANGCFRGATPFDAFYGRNICVSTVDDPAVVMANERTDERSRAGAHSFYAYLHPSDPTNWPSSEATHRSEISPKTSNPFGWDPTLDLDASGAPIDRWYGFSLYLPDDIMLASDDLAEATRFIFAQWQHGTAGSPAVSLHVRGDEFVVNLQQGTAPDGLSRTQLPIGPVVTGRWVDWVVHIRWHHTEGAVEVWQNGRQVLDRTGVRTVHANIDNVSRLKLGIYYWQWKERSVVERALAAGLVPRRLYIDEVRLYQGDDRGYERVTPTR